jgi:hypothetical protein
MTTVSQAPSSDSYLKIDELPEYDKGINKIQITSEAELQECMRLQEGQKCHMYIGNDEIHIAIQQGAKTTKNRTIFQRLQGKEATKTVTGKQSYIIKKVATPTLDVDIADSLSLLLKDNKIERTPIFSSLAAPAGYEKTEGSIYMSGVKLDPKTYDATAIR